MPDRGDLGSSVISPSVKRKPVASSRSFPGVRMVTLRDIADADFKRLFTNQIVLNGARVRRSIPSLRLPRLCVESRNLGGNRPAYVIRPQCYRWAPARQDSSHQQLPRLCCNQARRFDPAGQPE